MCLCMCRMCVCMCWRRSIIMVMEKIDDFIKKIANKVGSVFKPEIELQEGVDNVHSKVIEFQDMGRHKFHLRILKDGSAILIVDAQFVVYLNHTAMIYIHQFLDGKTLEQIKEFFAEHYYVEPHRVENDYREIMDKIATLIQVEDGTPINELGFKIKGQTVNDFPFRADLAITYRNGKHESCFEARSKDMEELKTDEMKKILDKLWKLGVPNIVFVGGEPSEREDLMELIDYSEKKGFVTGLVTNGVKFSDEDLVKEAINKGLDHVQLTLHSHDENFHNKVVGSSTWRKTVEAVKNFEGADIFFIVRITLAEYNKQKIIDTVKWLHEDLHVNEIAINALINFPDGVRYKHGVPKIEIENLLARLFSLADELGINIRFYAPNQYLITNAIEVGLGPKQGSAGVTSITIEPNGDVIPSLAYLKSVGNILKDDWHDIWYSRLFKNIRKSEYTLPNVEEADLLTICGGGTPLDLD
ncbi:MAG: radical SAM protein [Candidatus Lokiarchaeota archaeon]|nr:radical SAM protein [Candidatus Lokiarchaeota archaeon]